VEERVSRVAEALLKAQGRSLVVSDSDDVAVQLLVLALNELLGNVGQTVDLSRPLQQKQGRDADMARLLGEMQRGEVAALLVHDCNPVYTYPRAEQFAAALKSVPCSVSFAVTPDETARATTYHCPSHHPMECWGDAEPEAGRLSLFQPTIRPLYQTRAFEDSLLRWSDRQQRFYDYLRHHWQTKIHPRVEHPPRRNSGACGGTLPDHCEEAPEFVAFWDQMLQRGYLELPPPASNRSPLAADKLLAAVHQRAKQDRSAGAVEIDVFEPVALRDGAAANNPWLQELPDPVTKITWDNFAAISPALAREKGIEEGQWIEITAGDRKLQAPAHIQPGQHARTVSLALGYGRTHAGPVGDNVGVSAYPLVRAADGRFRYTAVECAVAPVAAPGRQRREFARTQIHGSMEGRSIVLETTYREFQQDYTAEHGHHASSHADLWEEHDYPEYKWGMAIDLTKCIGCSGCVTACDIENNIPVVGPEEVGRQREMHWLRIDRYFNGDAENPEVVHQPMLCQQCDNASCETVCPALATVHDDQGLNVQVYNRCVGTRYCSNNCAYKARRFNFFNNISNDLTQNLALNPDVTVRSRGVMEKCTFCIQRIQEARIIARREGRTIRDGEVRPACEQSCPADAIVFGNLKDPNSRVSRLAASPRRYRVLEELNRKPAIYYLALVRNNEEAEV
jgi:molybdopterin-containing oxidoreductase family iron-sulfur binding subunit